MTDYDELQMNYSILKDAFNRLLSVSVEMSLELENLKHKLAENKSLRAISKELSELVYYSSMYQPMSESFIKNASETYDKWNKLKSES